MVVVPKPKQIRSEKALKSSVKYILNPDKTDEQILTSGYHIENLNLADIEMNYTRILARKMIGRQNKQVLAHHLVQSFRPEDGLSAEKIHQLGREWVEELTGGKHEYIIATHIDKEHIHNHIILNATSNVDFKNFRWQKDTLQLARELSDKISEKYGAILEKTKPYQNNHRSYKKYLSENPIRPELKNRLNFLLKHSLNLKDFVQKAKLLDIEIDFSGKYTTYRLTDFEQKRPIRDSSLISKDDKGKIERHPEKRIFSKEQIELRCQKNEKNNKIVFGKSEILLEYQKQQEWYKANTDVKLIVEPWQINSVTPTGLRLQIEAGHRKGTVKIENYLFNKVGENYELHISSFSKFKFLDDKNQNYSAFIMGRQVIDQLASENERLPIRKNYGMNYVHNLFEAQNLLSKHGITGKESFKHLGEEFIGEMEKVEQALEQLDERIVQLTDRVKFNQDDPLSLQQLKNLQTERKTLELAYKEITDKLEIYGQLEEIQEQSRQNSNSKERENTNNVRR
jgi:Type IV secretory pathway, VirD2 components (relaxase)